MNKNYSKEQVKQLLNKLGHQLFRIENYYLVYSELGLHYNKSVSAVSSKAYVDAINSHKGFFIPIQEALRSALTIELNSFIISRDAESFKIAIEHLKQLENAPDLSGDYISLKRKNNKIMEHISTFRNQYYAHKSGCDLSVLPTSSDKEFQDLFTDIKNIFNKASSYFGNQFLYMQGGSRESVKDTHDLMSNLLRGEGQRVSEINVEYISDIYDIGKKKWMEQ